MDLASIKGVGPVTRTKLENAGVKTVEDLANASPEGLAASAGLPAEKAKSFILQAQGLLAAESTGDEDGEESTPGTRTLVPDGAPAPNAEATDAWRVVLRDRTSTARIVADGILYDDVPIVTARMHEADDIVLSGVEHDAVLLKEQSTTAAVRLNDAVRGGLPIYKERILDEASGTSEMVRVRVHEIRERDVAPNGNGASAPKKGLLARLFGK